MILILGLVALILSLATVVLVTVLSSRNAEKAFQLVDSLHQRQSEQNDKTLDRLMTIRWEDYVATQTLEPTEEGGFFPPTERVEEENDEEVGTWGALRGLRRPERLDSVTDEERALLDEDFPDEAEG
jgi:hypothetical protein